MNHSISLANELNATGTLPVQPGVLVAKRHHLLVRWSHWLNVPLLLGLMLSVHSRKSASANGQKLIPRLRW